jgi:hypothetical protein
MLTSWPGCRGHRRRPPAAAQRPQGTNADAEDSTAIHSPSAAHPRSSFLTAPAPTLRVIRSLADAIMLAGIAVSSA